MGPDRGKHGETKRLRLRERLTGHGQEKIQVSWLGLAGREHVARREDRQYKNASGTTPMLDLDKHLRRDDASAGAGVGEIPRVPGLDDARHARGPVEVAKQLLSHQLIVKGLLG